MQYRNDKRGKQISQLGFGAMRLPVIDGNSAMIDEASTEKMFLYAYEHGVNYYDTAYVYHEGMSEGAVGKILKRNHIRDKVNVATKLPLFTLDNFDPYKLLDTQLKRLDTDRIDFYLFHNMNEKKWDKIKQMDILKFIDDAKKSGKIGYIGFSSIRDSTATKRSLTIIRGSFPKYSSILWIPNTRWASRGWNTPHPKIFPLSSWNRSRAGRSFQSTMPKSKR